MRRAVVTPPLAAAAPPRPRTACWMRACTCSSSCARAPCSSASSDAPTSYGDKVKLVNQYKIGEEVEVGRYLDTCGHVGDTTPPSFGVRTSPSEDRAEGSGTWQIVGASGPVCFGDKGRLLNQYKIAEGASQGEYAGYLDTCGIPTSDDGLDLGPARELGVRTSPSPNRDQGSGTWQIVVA